MPKFPFLGVAEHARVREDAAVRAQSGDDVVAARAQEWYSDDAMLGELPKAGRSHPCTLTEFPRSPALATAESTRARRRRGADAGVTLAYVLLRAG